VCFTHTHDAIQSSSKQKKQQQQEVSSVVLREPKAFEWFYQIYPKRTDLRKKKEAPMALWL
jgi:hypothetical protein